jgi:hypothetical protein
MEKKKVFCLSILMFFACLSVNAQKIKKKEFDKFTKLETVITSTETLYTRSIVGVPTMKFKFNIKKAGDTYTMFATISNNVCDGYDKTSGIILLLSDGNVVKLNTNFTGVSSKLSVHSPLWDFETSFNISSEAVAMLKENDIDEVRVTTVDSYYDIELKTNKKGILRKMIRLFDK